MSDMKCPFCGKEIIKLNEVMYGCVCDDTLDKYGTKELWQELITTRKALDAAKDAVVGFANQTGIAMRALAKISKQDTDWCNKEYLVAIARNALDEITAIEQKEQR